MGKIHGKIKDSRNSPINEVKIVFENKGDPNSKDELESIADGTYKTISLKAGDYKWSTSKNKYVMKNGEISGVPGGNKLFEVPEIVLEDAGVISGKVLDQAGTAIQNAQVTATDAAGNVFQAVAPTDANGAYQIQNLAPGVYTVDVVAPAGYQNQPNVQVQAGQDTANIDFQPAVQPGSISGKVIDQAGAAIQNAQVTATDAAGNVFQAVAPTDANGAYQIQNLAPGVYTVDVVAPAGFQPQPNIQVQAAPVPNVDFQLAAVPAQPGSISGKVTDQAGAVVPGAQVAATDAAGNASPAVATNANGDYQIGNLAPGSYTISVIAPSGYLSQRNILVIPGQNTANVDFRPTLPQNFFNFRKKLKDSKFAKDAPVNIDEAMYFYAFYGAVANYMSANVLLAIENLDNFLTSNTSVNGLTLTGQKDLLEKHGAKIDEILEKRRNLSPSETDVLNQSRRQFNLGTMSLPIEQDVNTEFQAKFRELVSLCNDDLFGINLATARKSQAWSPDKEEKFFDLLKNVKRGIIDLMGNMSFYGTDGTLKFLAKWQKIIDDTIEILNDVAINHVASDDDDQKHIWPVLAKLSGQQKSQIDPYIVHANQGAAILYYVIKIYEYMINNLEKEDNDHLEDVFQSHQFEEESNPGVKSSASKLLKTNAGLVFNNWIPEWPT